MFHGRRFTWNFLLAAVSFIIVGVDFLRHFQLMVDPAANMLEDKASPQSFATVSVLTAAAPPSAAAAGDPAALPTVTGPWSPVNSHWSSVTGRASSFPSLTADCCGAGRSSHSHRSSVTGQRAAAPAAAPAALSADSVEKLLADFPTVVNSSKTLPRRPSGDVEHHIVTKGPPLSCRFRRPDSEKLAAAKKEFLQMEKDGIIRRSDSPWSSPLHMVQKPDGSWQPCGDYRRLNLVTVPDSYPLPNMLDFSERIAGCKIFSKVNLQKGYHQILMHPADILKTAIATPFGLFKFLRMTFGLRNAGNTFQQRMDHIMAGLDFVFVYLDDVIIGSRSVEEHVQHLRTLSSGSGRPA
jgi:hypothetical protein